jgi:hypothetical protein
MKISGADKITFLLNRMEFHTKEIQRREEKEARLFEWSTTLLLAIFAVVMALSDRSSPLPYQLPIKLIASLLIIAPTFIFIVRILGERKTMYRHAQVIEKIQSNFHLFEKGYYVKGEVLYPAKWEESLAESMLRRKTPIYYAAVLIILGLSVIATLWLIL